MEIVNCRLLRAWRCVVLLALVAISRDVSAGLGLPEQIVSDTAQAGAFPLVAGGTAAPLWLDANDWAGVLRAAGDLRADVQRVTTILPTLSTAGGPPSNLPVIIGTVGRSAVIDSLIAAGKLNASDLTGKWESFVITVVSQPMPGVDQAVVIAGSDKRGTIYGIYELSEQLGVSPWYYWADVPSKSRTSAYVLPGRFASGEPVVKYRGIFLNDEAPCLTGWAAAKFGGMNQQVYTKVFELLLRLRANYLWPAMWGNAFNEDDPADPSLADQYGIVMGTSHHEPMLRAQQEWSRHKTAYGNAAWDYQTNEVGLKQFWTDGIARNKSFESIVTVGMRGDGDEPMISGGSMADNVALLSRIITDQRTILTTQTGKPAEQTPQIWALYKEVLDYYDYGMRVPDDVTLLWPDDNWGNIRRLPATAEERNRSGGSGVYYHFDYVGGPRNYKWLNTNPLPKIQEQMNLAWQHGATRVWIVNVGDLKPMEVPIEFFLRLAWNPARWSAESTGDFLKQWAAREFGAAYADEAAAIVAAYTKYNGWRKPELLETGTFSLQNYREAERIRQQWRDLATRAQVLYDTLPANAKDAFYQLVLHPTKACSIVNDLTITAALNNFYATQQRASTNTLATQAQALFQADAALVTYWNNTLAGGKWNHMMDQVHLGYTTWSDPAQNTIPTLSSYTAPATADLGVALEGATGTLAAGAIGSLPSLNSEGGATSRFIDVFRRGTSSVSYTITANQPWVSITNASGTLGSDTRAEVSIDWSRTPTGSGEAILTIQGLGSTAPRTVHLPFVKTAAAAADRPVGFLDPEGYLAIEAPHYDRAVDAGGVSWKISPDLGRTVGGVMPLPVTAASVTSPGGETARLEYDVYLRRKGDVTVRLVVSPTLNFFAGRMQRCAISLDNQTPQIVNVGADVSGVGWDTSVKDSVRVALAQLTSDAVGPHVLKFWMVDPGVVLQRIEVDAGGLKTSYLGPPESPRGQRATAVADSSPGSGSVVTIEAESGTLGAEYPAITTTVPGYISPTTDGTGTSPGSSARVATYQVTFPAAGTYRLFARVRVGAGGANDDSLFLGNGFGTKSPTTAGNWKMVNNLGGIGFTASSDVVAPNASSGTAGSGVWKWIDLSTLSSTTFIVPAGALTQTLQIGARENGFDIDKLVFGLTTDTFTVDNLTQGATGAAPSPMLLPLEAEASTYGAELTSTTGTPAYLTVSTNTTSTAPGSAARVMRFQAIFPVAGIYRLLARIRVGSGGANDDSLFVGASLGAKDPTLANDWKTINGLAGVGFSTSTDVVTTSPNGTAGTTVWKWVDLSSLAGAGPYIVSASALTQTLDIGGREDGLAIDKIAFVPDGNIYTVADLDSGSAGIADVTVPVFTAVVGEVRQTIDGFGASSAWNGTTFSDALSDTLFSSTNGIGLSLLRIRIAPDGTTVETGTAKKAVARGARVWATPWSPPAAWKSNNDVNNGGTLLPERYADWAALLADLALSLKNAGVPLAALSAQNEPNYTATWESCTWTPATMTTFIRNNLGPALVSRGVATRVLAPETISSIDFPSYANAILNDSVARTYVSTLGLHCYGATPAAYPAAASGLSYWETEFTDDSADSDPGMDSALRVAAAIHDFLAVAQGNAWHYWWLTQGATASTGSLTENNVLAKRGWAMGNWARFVRPGARRVETYGSTANLRTTAFITPSSRRFVFVVVNKNVTAATVPLAINAGGVPSLTPWETSETRSLTALPAITPAADGSFTLQIPARSVTTFVSDALNRAPTAIALDNTSVMENRPAGSVVGHLSAADADAGETFTYTLVAGVGGADNAAFTIVGNELRTVAPLDFESAASRTIRVRVTDSVGAAYEQVFAVTVINDPGEYADWSASLPLDQRGATADANGDGSANLLAYAFGATALQGVPADSQPAMSAASSGSTTFFFLLPSAGPSDVRYFIERSPDLGSWTVLATRDGNGAWQGDVIPAAQAAPGGRTRFSIAVPGGGPAFYRVRTMLIPAGI